MTERHILSHSLPRAYHQALYSLRMSGDIVDCPDWNTRQLELAMTMEITNPLEEPMISRCIPCGAYELEQYRMEMLDGILDFEIGHGWDYTYHNRMTQPVDQVQFVISELKRNPESRRAVIMVRSAEDIGSEDPTCLQFLQFFIRPSKKYPQGQLDCFVLFRSNDAVKAAFMNAFALIMLQKKIADALRVPVGSYVHRANSFHAYERDWALLDSYCSRIRRNGDLFYYYSGDWKDQMAEARPLILQKVEDMKQK